jgi:hypothetical protein
MIQRIVQILSVRGPMTAGKLGLALWWRKGLMNRPENVNATMFCRPAGALLRRAQRAGLVRCDRRGSIMVWYANARLDFQKESAERQ